MIKIKIDLNDQIEKRIGKVLESRVQKSMDERIDDAVTDLIKFTPIDTGYARSRWTSYKQNSFKVSFSLTNKFLINFVETNYIVENDAEYIQYLNAGSSKQAPAFFVERTLINNGFQPTLI